MISKTNITGENTADITLQYKYSERVRAILETQMKDAGRRFLVYVLSFGCQQNEADGERLLGTALTLGYEKTDDITRADLIIYNTCAVREHAELRALSKAGELKRLKERNPYLLVGLWGCMVSQEHRVDDVKHRYPYVDFVAGTNMLHRLPEILCDVLENKRRRFYVDDADYSVVEGIPVERSHPFKAWLSIMYGCNNFCTYCVVPYVRGRERSRSPEAVIAEAKLLIENGYKEITLLGQNVNSYAASDGTTFPSLLRQTASFDGEYLVRFMTSHPKDVSDELIEVIASNPHVAHHFHLPLQSGSSEILRRMNRKYDAEKYFATVEKLKKAIPDITLTTDIIVGFPGETEADFEATLDMVKQVGYDSMYPFIYSPRKGTPAAVMDDPTSPEEKTERMARLLSLHRDIATNLNKQYIGKTVRVLCETPDGERSFFGHTSGAKGVRFKAPEGAALFGKFVDVKIESAGDVYLEGTLVG